MIIETAEAAQKRRTTAAVAVSVGNVLLLPLEAWFLMLLLGALHVTFPVVPVVSYGAAVVLMLSVHFAAIVAGKFHRIR